MNRVISLSVLFALILLLGGMLFHVIAPFILPLFLAAVLAVICQPMQAYFQRKCGERRSLAAALTTCAVVALVVVPLVIGTFFSAVQLYSLAEQHLDGDWHRSLDLLWTRTVTPAIERLEPIVPGGLSEERIDTWKRQFGESMQSLARQLAGRTFQYASSTVGMFVSLTVAAGIFITALYYFLADGPLLIAAAEELIPVPADHQRRLRERFSSVVRAVVTATFLAALIQGFATAIAINFCGIGHFWVFLAVATVASVVPLVGAWIVWVPCAVWLGLQGNWMAASLLTFWGVCIVSMLDNIVKIYVLQNDTDLHPLLAFLSVVGALQVLGLWGIFIGPIVASCLFALIHMFNAELKELVQQGNSQANPEPPTPLPSQTGAVIDAAVPVPVVATPSSNPSHSGGSGVKSKRRK
ncbi:AI-2E family transporter [Schlesneria sp. T3-172]|uniref:AI-2E family transporter n=1 Tax=Schlesneria sphaerica TaxID=3373610 RepID=UPI0037C79B0D